jgi:two-component system chemotaxis response regulator CheY
MSLREKLRVMVVDDMATSRGLITQALESFGISNIATATDGKSALAALARAPVHLVISDYNMPEMDGLHLLHYLRNTPQTQKIGFLLITGRADPAVINKGKQLGMNNYVAKPFQAADLKAAIETIVGRL